MFRGSEGGGYDERVDVIGNKKFIEFVEQLEREEDIQLDTLRDRQGQGGHRHHPARSREGRDGHRPPRVEPDPDPKDDACRGDRRPCTSPRRAPPSRGRKTTKAARDFHYEGYDLLTLKKIIDRDYTIPAPQTAEEVIGFYARRIAQDVKLPGQFAALVPKVREFLETKAFGVPVDLSTPEMVKAIGSNVAQYVTVRTFAHELRKLVVQELEPELVGEGRRLSETGGFPWSRPTYDAPKCVFNLVPCSNQFEREFAVFLQKSEDVARFSKIPERFEFSIEYTDASGNLRYYEPDFVAVTQDGTHHILETKGQEDVTVAYKDRAAQLWCENATRLTGQTWSYLKVRQADYNSLQPTSFADLGAFGSLRLFKD